VAKRRLTAALGIVFVAIAIPGYAQATWGAGVTGGVNISKVHATNCRVDQEPCDLENQAGFTGGGFLTIAPASPTYQIEAEVLFAMKGGKDPGGSKDRNKLNYLEIPVLARLNLTVGSIKPFVVVGPSFGLRLSAKDSSGDDIKDDIKVFDPGIVFGGGAALTSTIAVGVRFQQSLVDILTDTGRKDLGVANQPNNKFNNRSISFLVEVDLK
jgi:hypothetical protein